MRAKGSAERLEYRRQLAGQRLDEGRGITEVARLVKASPSSVHRWQAMQGNQGEAGLQAKPHPGRPCRLKAADKVRLLALLVQGPLAAGYDTDLWTCQRVAELIRQEFGVDYHPDHVGKLLHSRGFSCQYPEQRARAREEETIRQWRLEDWPRIKKKPANNRRRLP